MNKNKLEIKNFTTAELEAELLERHRRDELGKINDYRDIVALRNQLLEVSQKSVKHDAISDTISMKKKDYDLLIGD
jgi:uncharacterized protein YeeX (DUF496 family)